MTGRALSTSRASRPAIAVCNCANVGLAANDPLTLGGPGGPVIRVMVVVPIAGLLAGRESWVTGHDAEAWIAAGHLRRL